VPSIPRQITPTVGKSIVKQPLLQDSGTDAGTQQFAGAIGTLGQQLLTFNKERDKAEAESALIAFDDAKNVVLFGPENGYYNSQGRDAVDNVQPTLEQLDTLTEQYSTSIKSNNARKMFNQAISLRMSRDKTSIFQHSAKGLQTWRLGNSKLEEENALKNSTVFWNSDEDLALYISKGELAIMDRQQYMGSEQTQADLETFRSSFAKSAIDGALASDNVERAKVLQKKYDSRITGIDRVKITKDIQNTVDKLYVNEQAVSIFSSEKNLNDMVKEAEDLDTTPENINDIERIIGNKYTLSEKAKDEQIENTVNQWDQSIANGTPYSQVPLDVKNLIGVSGRNALINTEREFVTGENTVTDQIKYQDLINLPTRELAKVVPYEHFSYLNKAERKTLRSSVNAAKKGVKTADLTRLQSNSTIAKNAVKQILGRSINQKKESDVTFANEFYGLVADEIHAQESVKDAKLNEPEVRKIVDDLVKNWVIERPWWFDATKKLNDVPVDRLDELANQLRTRGMAITSENIIKLNDAAEKAGVYK